jgi:hypothetical protein
MGREKEEQKVFGLGVNGHAFGTRRRGHQTRDNIAPCTYLILPSDRTDVHLPSG